MSVESPNNSMQALVVDDEPISRQMIVFALQQEGFSCVSADDGVEASRMLEFNDYEIVVTDLQMPNKSGFELVHEMMSLDRRPLVIVHTALVQPNIAKELISLGVDDIVFKPVDYATFASKIRALHYRHQMNAAARGDNQPRVVVSIESVDESPLLTEDSSHDLKVTLEHLGVSRHIDHLANYELKELLGAGSMGEVYAAKHSLLNRDCAIKFMNSDITASVSVRDRFIREVRAVAQISHRNHVSVFDFGVTREGKLYYVMEKLHGETFETFVENQGKLSFTQILDYLAQTCEGLEAAHRLGLIHRDIKPSNLMLIHSQSGHEVVKILDFGLVLESSFDSTEETYISEIGTSCGTPAYMAPEQIRDSSSVDARADIYALGATAYALLTGRPPFNTSSPLMAVNAHLHDEVEPLRNHNPAIPPELEDIVLKCLQKEPNDRFPSAEALREALCHSHLVGNQKISEKSTVLSHESQKLQTSVSP